jgi:hypothetical protein
MTSLTSLLQRLTQWTSIGSQISASSNKNHHHLQDVEKAERGEQEPSSRPVSAPAAPPVPRMDLVIPDIEDTIMDTAMDPQDKDKEWTGYYEPPVSTPKSSAVPVIIISRVRAESGDYTSTWDVAGEEDADDGPSHA